ncbi:hypothetical protein BO83DRAFT_249234 [Aspergillus eucalypticola CBS 122712]|uniref:Uncharacterized protein n=1 Tax=Aspergillus eucalypticola (strain CBS 122712 / IBT 29274) TaxID=1448314 RepID=A0A317VRI2_ASPEC|nr:uncharacterized protein BO83DRAFT_249234 [Aspergillus eucalypticola CBS 122712]PWY75901.1 hypothetical protein BO83DRAFT_249234 [Aspergillus eucalypticola CBS 122712]
MDPDTLSTISVHGMHDTSSCPVPLSSALPRISNWFTANHSSVFHCPAQIVIASQMGGLLRKLQCKHFPPPDHHPAIAIRSSVVHPEPRCQAHHYGPRSLFREGCAPIQVRLPSFSYRKRTTALRSYGSNVQRETNNDINWMRGGSSVQGPCRSFPTPGSSQAT